MAYTVDPTIENLTDADLANLAGAVATEQNDRALIATRDEVQALIDASANLQSLGAAAAIADNGDPAWVVVSFDVANLTQPAKALAIGALFQMRQAYSAQWVTQNVSVRNLKNVMLSNLAYIDQTMAS